MVVLTLPNFPFSGERNFAQHTPNSPEWCCFNFWFLFCPASSDLSKHFWPLGTSLLAMTTDGYFRYKWLMNKNAWHYVTRREFEELDFLKVLEFQLFKYIYLIDRNMLANLRTSLLTSFGYWGSNMLDAC